MIRGAIFDLDGTLLDSMSIWDTIGEDYLRSLRIEPKENLKETFRTFSLEQSAEYYRTHYGVTLSIEEIIRGVTGLMERFYREAAPLKPGVERFLRELRERDVRMCVASVTDQHLVEAALSRLGVREYFSAIFTCGTVGHGKEEPYIYREAQRHIGTEKRETAVFEDALHALNTAKSDGFLTVAVYDAHEENQTALRTAADYYLKDFSDFHGFWRAING